jgi:tol-pal system protein YbgF
VIASRSIRALCAPVVILTAGACFATRSDVRVLQSDLQVVRGDLHTTRGELLARDSAFARALADVAASLAVVDDTVRSMHATTMRLRGDVREDLQAIRQQLITIQERTGESSRRIQELRAQLETDAADRAAADMGVRDTIKPPPGARPPVAGATPSTANPAGAAAPASPGPAQLYQLAQDQFRRGSAGSARAAYTQLLTQYPTSDLAPDALYGVAETWASEGNNVSADSVYALVVERYPQSQRAPTALYKRATALRVVGQTEQARVLFQQIVDKYPKSDAALLAEGFLGARRP